MSEGVRKEKSCFGKKIDEKLGIKLSVEAFLDRKLIVSIEKLRIKAFWKKVSNSQNRK